MFVQTNEFLGQSYNCIKTKLSRYPTIFSLYGIFGHLEKSGIHFQSCNDGSWWIKCRHFRLFNSILDNNESLYESNQNSGPMCNLSAKLTCGFPTYFRSKPKASGITLKLNKIMLSFSEIWLYQAVSRCQLLKASLAWSHESRDSENRWVSGNRIVRQARLLMPHGLKTWATAHQKTEWGEKRFPNSQTR